MPPDRVYTVECETEDNISRTFVLAKSIEEAKTKAVEVHSLLNPNKKVRIGYITVGENDVRI